MSEYPNDSKTLPKFKHIPILVMLALTVITLGLYPSAWFLYRRGDIKQIDRTGTKILDNLIHFYVFSQLALYIIFGLWEFGYLFGAYLSFIGMVMTAISIYLALYIRELLRTYVANAAPENPLNAFVASSILFTCFLGVFYLQTHINILIDAHVFEERI